MWQREHFQQAVDFDLDHAAAGRARGPAGLHLLGEFFHLPAELLRLFQQVAEVGESFEHYQHPNVKKAE